MLNHQKRGSGLHKCVELVFRNYDRNQELNKTKQLWLQQSAELRLKAQIRDIDSNTIASQETIYDAQEFATLTTQPVCKIRWEPSELYYKYHFSIKCK